MRGPSPPSPPSSKLADGPYRQAQQRGSGPPLTVYFLPQFRIYLAPICLALALMVVRGAWSADFSLAAFRHGVSCESTIHTRTGAVSYATCQDERYRSFPCTEAKARLASYRDPGWMRRDLRIRSGRSDAPVSYEAAAAQLDSCLPAEPPAVNPGSYESGESRRAYIILVADDYRFAFVVTVLVLLALLTFVPSRFIRIRLDAATGTLRVRDFAIWRRARVMNCLLADVADASVVNSRVVLVQRNGSLISLTNTDRRPTELKKRTAARIGDWLSKMREL